MIRCGRRYWSITTRQAGFKRGRLSIRQRNTRFRSGMAAQHTLNASPMQACRSSWVSAIAVEHKNGIVNATAIRAGTCFDLADSMGSVSLPEADENARIFLAGDETTGCGRYNYTSHSTADVSGNALPLALPERHLKATVAAVPMAGVTLWIKKQRTRFQRCDGQGRRLDDNH